MASPAKTALKIAFDGHVISDPLRLLKVGQSYEVEAVDDSPQIIDLNIRLVKEQVRPAYRGGWIDDMKLHLGITRCYCSTVTKEGTKLCVLYYQTENKHVVDQLKEPIVAKNMTPAEADCLFYGRLLDYLEPKSHVFKNAVGIIGWMAGKDLLFTESISSAVTKEMQVEKQKRIQSALPEQTISIKYKSLLVNCGGCNKQTVPALHAINQLNGKTIPFCSHACATAVFGQ